MIHFGIIFLLFLFLSTSAKAVTISVSSPSATISADIFKVDVAVLGATNATNYLRVDLYKEGTTNYFGETYNGSDWYSGSDGKSYFPVQILNSSAAATLQVQIGNPGSTEYSGPGSYKLKIRRYTSSGSAASNDTQTPIDVQIVYATPIPTPTFTPTPTTVPTAVPTEIPTTAPTQKPTNTPSPSHTPRPTPTIKPSSTPKPSRTPTPESTIAELSAFVTPTGVVLGETVKNKSSTFFKWLGLLFGGVGAVMIATAAAQIGQKKDSSSV
jgi:cell division septation protein DedD